MPEIHETYEEAEKLKEDGKLEEAVGKLQEILTVDESHALSHAALAVIYGKLQKHDEAMEHAKRVCELEPKDPFSHMQLSVVCQKAFMATQNQQYVRDAEEAMARSRMMQEGQ